MATPREIKRRIRSVQNIGKITRAMQAVAASKMKRAQEQVLASRPYAQKAWEILTYVASQPVERAKLHPLLQQRPIEMIGLVLITPDRGLCGGLIANILRLAADFLMKQDKPLRLVTVGRRGRDFMLRHGQDVYAEFSDIPDQPTLADVRPIARLVIDDFVSSAVDQVCLIFTDFINAMTQRPVMRQLLPIQPAIVEERTIFEYLIEPDPRSVLDELLPRFTELQVYQAILEALASEHSARMVAMRNATENAEELVEDLTLSYNKARQEAITKEIVDIAGGAEALAKAIAAAR